MTAVLSQLMRLSVWRPLFPMEAPWREAYPMVPLSENQALGIALFSYAGGVFWGINADWDAVPDLHDLEVALREEFDVLHRLAGPAIAA